MKKNYNVFSLVKKYARLSDAISKQREVVEEKYQTLKSLGETFDSEFCAQLKQNSGAGDFQHKDVYVFDDDKTCSYFAEGKSTCGRVRCAFYVCNNEYVNALAKYNALQRIKSNFMNKKRSRAK